MRNGNGIGFQEMQIPPAPTAVKGYLFTGPLHPKMIPHLHLLPVITYIYMYMKALVTHGYKIQH